MNGTISFDGTIPSIDLEASWCKPGYPTPQLRLWIKGDNGNLTITDYYVELNLTHSAGGYSSGNTTAYRQDLWKGVEFSLGGPEYCREDKHLVDSARQNKSTIVDVETGYDVQKTIGAMYDSISKGGSRHISW